MTQIRYCHYFDEDDPDFFIVLAARVPDTTSDVDVAKGMAIHVSNLMIERGLIPPNSKGALPWCHVSTRKKTREEITDETIAHKFI